MQTLFDYLTAARGRGQGLRGQAETALQSFLSSALPQQTVGQLNLLNEVLNPVAAFEAAGQSAQRVANPDLSGRARAMAGLETAATVGAAALPGVGARMARGATDDIARALQETVIGSSMASDRPARFMADESGAVGRSGPLPPPRNSAERVADEAARLMREGDLEQAESLMQFADDRRLFQLYERGEVGANLPMDQASRMDRARDMGNVEPEYVGSLEPNIRAFDPRMARGERRYGGSFSSDSPAVASSYADPNRGTVYPLVTRGMPEDAVRYDAQGTHWNRLSGSDNVQIGDRTAGPISTIVDSPGMRGMYDTNQVSRLAFYDGRSGTEFANVIDRGPFYPQVANDPSIAQAFQRAGAEPSTVRARQDTRGMRSRFARFDPRFADSRNIMAGVGGLSLLDYALGREQPEY